MSAREKIDKSKRGTLQCAPALVVLITIICMILFATMCVCITRPTEIASLLNLVTGKGNTQTLQEPPEIIDLNTLEMSALEAQADHDCSKYLVSKYDTTNHWNECTECETKYNVTAHVYTETWTMGESCHPNNKCNHVCSCGYSYQSNNTRKHTPLEMYSSEAEYYHEQTCSVCNFTIISRENCIKEDGSKINCQNLGTCKTCNHTYTIRNHSTFISGNGDAKCRYCNIYIGTISNLETKRGDKTFEFSYDFSISSSGNLDNVKISTSTLAVTTGIIKEYHTKTDTSTTSIHVTGKVNIPSNYENKFNIHSQIRNFYASESELVSGCIITLNSISPDIDPPVINTDIEQTDLATSNGWATQKRITVTGTENFCKTLKLTLKDSEGNVYLNNAATTVTDNAWSYTFTPDIEADENGKEFTITATDNLGNKSEQTFMVYKTDKKAPTMTSPEETSQDWTTEKEWTFTATDEGSGGVQISIGDANHYTLAVKSNGVYSKPYTFTGDTYGSKDVKVYFKDGLGNTREETIKVYNIDTTAPTITNHEIVNKEIVLTGNDINATLNKEGSGIVGYRYIGDSKEDVGAGPVSARNGNNLKQNPINRIRKSKIRLYTSSRQSRKHK